MCRLLPLRRYGEGKHHCGCHGRMVNGEKRKKLKGCGDNGGVALGGVGSVLERFRWWEHAPGMPFKIPADGPDIPDLEGNGAEEMKQLYNLHSADYNRALQFKVQIKWLLLPAIPCQYIAILQHHLLQFTIMSPTAILKHVVTTYVKIHACDLERNLLDIA